jgi:site-specific DNA-methyltransferase (adenine-specific)
MYEIHNMDCRLAMSMLLDADSVDSIVTDPPYGLSKEPDAAEVLRHWLAGDDYTHDGNGFMGKSWDSFVPGPAVWREAYRVLKPGGYLLAFFGTRTYDLGVMAIRLAGFEIRDEIAWCYGSGFPKSLNIGKAIASGTGRPEDIRRMQMGDAYEPSGRGRANYDHGGGSAMNGTNSGAAGTAWDGWGTALKPAHEPIVVARKPLAERTVAANVLAWGTGGINVDACRVGTDGGGTHCSNRDENGKCLGHRNAGQSTSGETFHGPDTAGGRFPPNLIHDGSDEVVACFPSSAGQLAKASTSDTLRAGQNVYGVMTRGSGGSEPRADTGSACRFFPSCPLDDEDVETQRLIYCAKASRADRDEGLDDLPAVTTGDGRAVAADNAYQRGKTARHNHHATVKPTALMRHLVRLVTPPGGTVLDPFTGSGSTGKAAILEGFNFIGCELDTDYVTIAEARCAHANRTA